MNDSTLALSVKANRRKFIAGSSAMIAGGPVVAAQSVVAAAAHAFGSDQIKIGLVGCGSRGTAATIQALQAAGDSARLVAVADVFPNNIQSALRSIKSKHPDKVDVDRARFVGLEGYQGVMTSEADVVFLVTPPGFRPLHFEAAVAAGKHVFMEKPVATDATGVRQILATNKIAKHKGLTVEVGLQRRHEDRYRQCIERLQQGIIGDFVFARAYWNGTGVRVNKRRPKQTELEYQLRNWYYFNWLSGDQITEQHVHNLDVINWLVGETPIEAQGQGGREVRRGDDFGQIFDHHMVEYTYPSGLRLLSQCRHIEGCANDIGEHVHATQGSCDISKARIASSDGKLIWQSKTTEATGKGWQQQQDNLFASLRAGEVNNNADEAAESTMTAIMGRMATYTGKVVKWQHAINSGQTLAKTEDLKSLADIAPVRRDSSGQYPVPIPGKTNVG